jgi:hypothetical protein
LPGQQFRHDMERYIDDQQLVFQGQRLR